MSPATSGLLRANAARSLVSIEAIVLVRSTVTSGRSLSAASACFLSIRACEVRSAAVRAVGSVKSVAPVERDEMLTFLALASLLTSTWAFALVRTTLVASAPAPATAMPAAPPKPAATLAAIASE